MEKKNKLVPLFARITQSFLRNAFPAFKTYFLQSLGFGLDAKNLIRVAANINQSKEKWPSYLIVQESWTTLNDKVTPLAKSSVFHNFSTKI